MCQISGVQDISDRIFAFAGYPIRQRQISGRISGIRQVPDIRPIWEYSGCIDYHEISNIIVLSYCVIYFRALLQVIVYIDPCTAEKLFSLCVTIERFEYQSICADLGENQYKLEKLFFNMKLQFWYLWYL